MTTVEAADFLDTTARTINRYATSGKLPYTQKKKKRDFKKRDLIRIAEELHGKIEKHRPDATSNEPPLTDYKLVRKAIATQTKSLLNDDGLILYKETVKHLKDHDLLKHSTEKVVRRYALASQMKDQYLALAEETQEKYHFDLSAQFQREIQHYEKELGLTPAALLKMLPQKEEKPIDVDPMEELLND